MTPSSGVDSQLASEDPNGAHERRSKFSESNSGNIEGELSLIHEADPDAVPQTSNQSQYLNDNLVEQERFIGESNTMVIEENRSTSGSESIRDNGALPPDQQLDRHKSLVSVSGTGGLTPGRSLSGLETIPDTGPLPPDQQLDRHKSLVSVSKTDSLTPGRSLSGLETIPDTGPLPPDQQLNRHKSLVSVSKTGSMTQGRSLSGLETVRDTGPLPPDQQLNRHISLISVSNTGSLTTGRSLSGLKTISDTGPISPSLLGLETVPETGAQERNTSDENLPRPDALVAMELDDSLMKKSVAGRSRTGSNSDNILYGGSARTHNFNSKRKPLPGTKSSSLNKALTPGELGTGAYIYQDPPQEISPLVTNPHTTPPTDKPDRNSPTDPPNSGTSEGVVIPEAFLVEDDNLEPDEGIFAIHAEPLQEQPTLPWWKQRQAKFLLLGVLATVIALAVAIGVLFSSNDDPPVLDLSSPRQSSPLTSFFPTQSSSPSTAPSLSPSFSSFPSMQPSVSILKGSILEEWQGSIRDNDLPDSTSTLLSGLEMFDDRREAFGARLRALIVPPETGVYYFYVAGAGSCELYLSCGRQETDKNLIAFTSLTPPPVRYEWDRYSSQMSDPISLVKGRGYYIEASYEHTDPTFTNHLEIGWESPENSIPLGVIDSSHTFLRYLPNDSDRLSPEPADYCFSSSAHRCDFDTIGETIYAEADGVCFKVEFDQSKGEGALFQKDCETTNGIYSNHGYNYDISRTSSNSLIFQDGDVCQMKRRSGLFRVIVDPSLKEVWVRGSQPSLCYCEFVLHTPNCTMLTNLTVDGLNTSSVPSMTLIP